MITGFYCTNIFSDKAAALIHFYHDLLEIPIIKTDDDDTNGVYLGFLADAPQLCIWDSQKFEVTPTGYQSFVFYTQNLDTTMEQLKNKGIAMGAAVRYDWGTYEVRLKDLIGNEVVIAEFTS